MTNKEFLESITLEGEEWRDVVGWEGLYAVSNLGRVVKYEHSQTWCNHGTMSTRVYEARLLVPTKIQPPRTKDYGCYLTVKLGPKKKRFLSQVHRLVAEAFIPNPNNYPHIDHIDGYKENNSANNLRWCTPKMNMNNPITIKRISQSNTGNTLICKNKRIPVVSIINGKLEKIYPSMYSVNEDGFSPMRVRMCCLGEKETHKGVQWRFLSDYKSSYQ